MDILFLSRTWLTHKIDTSKKLPHARLLTIQNSEFEITINPDGGFAQGWKAFREYSTTVENDRTKSIELTNTLYRNNIPIRLENVDMDDIRNSNIEDLSLCVRRLDKSYHNELIDYLLEINDKEKSIIGKDI